MARARRFKSCHSDQVPLLVSTESPTQLSTLTPKFNLAPGRGSPETAAPPTARPAARRLGFAGYVRRVCAGIGARHSMIKAYLDMGHSDTSLAGYPASAFDLACAGPWHPQPAKRILERLEG